LKCYVHRDVDAIGVCSECGQGVCDSCAVRIGGKLYCKEDIDRIFGRRKRVIEPEITERIERPLRVSILSISFFIYGFIGIGLGILFMIAGFTAGAVSSLDPYFSPLISFGVLAFGAGLFVMGIVGLVSGWWLWKAQMWGAVAGIPLLMLGIFIVSLLALIYPGISTYELALTVWIGNGFLLSGLFFSWGKLST
jgi:hypothetical protein